MSALVVIDAMEAGEATANTARVGQDTAPTVGSKSAASAGHETKLKVPKKVLTNEEKLVEEKNRQDQLANARLREAQQAVDGTMRVAASMALDMQDKANTHACEASA
jgi:hypothetical protein